MPRTTAAVVAAGSMAGRPQPQLPAEDLILRPWTAEDVPAIVAAYGDPDIQRWHTRWLTPSEAEEWVVAANASWSRETAATWAVTDQVGVLGRMLLNHLDLAEGIGEIAYWVLPAARGRNVATRALIALSDWAFAELGLHRLELEHSTRNLASCRVAAKAGFELEGTKRSQALHADGWHDMHLHALLTDRTPDPHD